MNLTNYKCVSAFLISAAIFLCGDLQAQTNCASPPSGLISWWKGDGNVLDQVSTNNGTLAGNTTYGPGRVGQGFVLDGSGDGVIVGNPPALQLQNFTIETWVRRASTSTVSFGAFGSGLIFGYGLNGYGLYLSSQGEPVLTKIDVSNVTSSQSITDTNFHHLAVTKSGSTVVFYIDGVAYPASAYDPGFTFSTTAAIGARGDNLDNSFLGTIDDLAIYSGALTAAEIQAIYNASSLGKCTSPVAPTIVSQPANQTVAVGQSSTFTVEASGSAPLSYQWLFNGSNIASAISSSFTLASVQLSNAGIYSVMISNSVGVLLSSNATLTVNPLPSCLTPASGLISWWRGEGNTSDSIGINNGVISGNATYGAGRVGQGFAFDGSGDGVVVGNPAALRLQNFTIETWVRRASTSTVSFGVFGNGVIFGYGQSGYGLYLSPAGQPALSKVNVDSVTSSQSITDTNFHHLAVTKSGSSVVFYIDGTAYPAAAYDPGFTFGTVAAIGARGDNLDNSFLGTIDDLAIYNRALSASEVLAIYNSDVAGKCTPSCVSPPSGLVSWWRGEGNANDSLGANNGVLTGAVTFASGEVGQAFNFDGVTGAIIVPAVTNVTLQDLTIEGWIYPTDVSIERPVVEFSAISGELSRLHLWYSVGSAGTLYGLIRDPGGAYLQVVSTGNLVASDQWNHVAMTFDRTAKKAWLYLNGVNVASNSSPVAIEPQLNVAINLGLRPNGSADIPQGRRHVGKMDEMSIYNRALTQAELQAIFSATSVGKCAPPVAPSIITQPTNQITIIGGSATFTVSATGTLPLTYQWQFNGTNINGANAISLTLNNAQLENAGNYSVVVTNHIGSIVSSNAVLTVNTPPPCFSVPSGLVGWWKAEGNSLDQIGTNNGVLSGNAAYGTGHVGQGFVFDGNGDGILIGNPPELQLQNFTIETWIKRSSVSVISSGTAGIAVIVGYGTGGYALALFPNGRPFLTQVAGGSTSPTNIISDTNFHHLAVTKSGSTVVFYVDGVASSAPNYDPGFVFTSPLGIGAKGDGFDNSFLGRVDEVSIYNRPLSASEILAIYDANSAGKCTTLPGTTMAPFISTQPATSTIVTGESATFTVVAGGSALLSYQWSFNGTNIANATASSFTVSDAQYANGGLYSILVTNTAGSVLSSNALLTVNPAPSALRVADTSAASSATVKVPILLTANGFENALQFSLSFNPSRLAYVSTALVSSNATLILNEGGTSTGRLGLVMGQPSGITFPAGTQQLAEVTFTTAIVTNATTTTISFVDQPVVRQVANTSSVPITATYSSGTVSIAAVMFEADLNPRPSGDKAVTVTDWVLVGLFAAHLDSPTNALEFQKADCAPRDTFGNGQVTIIDWVQAGRYAAVLDPLTPVGGPTEPPGLFLASSSTRTANGIEPVRQVQVMDSTFNQGQAGVVSVRLLGEGNENALGFSLTFDPALLSYTGATRGSAAANSALNVNTDNLSVGRVGFALALPSGTHFPTGAVELLKVTFKPAISVTNPISVSFGDIPITREISDPTAHVLPSGYLAGTISITPLPWLSILRAGSSNVALSWPSWASNFVLQENGAGLNSTGSWSTVTGTVDTTNQQSTITLPVNGTTKFYRLMKP
jgi:hypothetical protein